MLSKKQMRRLIQSVYGNSSEEGKEIERLYARASRQIKGEISQFIAGQANWSGKPSKAALDDVRRQLEALALDGAISSMANVFLSSLNLGHPKNSDLETARIAVPLLGVAQQRQRQLVGMGKRILDAVAKITHTQHQETPTMHQVPINYDRMLQRQASDSVTQRQQVSDAINRDIMDTVDKIRQIAKEAANSPKDNLNWADQVERVLTGDKKPGGASARAKMIIRTQACHELNRATIADFKARGVRQYRFLSLESINTCSRCSDMDYKVYEVADAQAGVNLPPMHPNCQCWIVEYGDEGYVSVSDLSPAPPSRPMANPLRFATLETKAIFPREGKTDPKLDAKMTEEIVVHDLRKLPVNTKEGAKPNQCIVAYKQGKLYERRYFDENGRAIKDIDYTDHGNPKYHKVPHVHDWVYNKEKGRISRQRDRDPRKGELS